VRLDAESFPRFDQSGVRMMIKIALISLLYVVFTGLASGQKAETGPTTPPPPADKSTVLKL